MWYLCERLLVSGDPILQQLYVLLIEECEVGVWILFRAEVENRPQVERLQERKIFLAGEAGPIHTRFNHAKIIGGNQKLLLVI